MNAFVPDLSSFRGVSYLILMLLYVGLLGWSWWKLKQHGLHSRRGELPNAGFLALTLVTLSFLIFLVSQSYAAMSSPAHNGNTNFPIFRFIGCILSIAALIAALGSRGWRRISASILSSVMVFLWTIMFVFGELA